MRVRAYVCIAIASLTLAAPAFAQFNPGPNPITGTETAARTLSSGTGTIDSGGQISIASGSTVPLTMTGTSTLINSGTIQTFGTGRAIDSNSGIANLTLTNNGLISSVSSDAFRVNTNSAVSLLNTGTIRVTNGGQAIDWAAITSASNVLTNQATGLISAVGEDAVRPGTGGRVHNFGMISATPIVSGAGAASGSDGVDLRTFTGIVVTNSGTITGRHAIATDGANAGPSVFAVSNNAGGLIAAINGSGLNIDGVSASVTAIVSNDFGATFRGGVMGGTVIEGDGDGIDVDGTVLLSNSGDILGFGARGGTNNAEGIAAGGGSILNTATGRIIGSSLAIDAPNGDTSRAGNGILIDNSNGADAVASTAVTNEGLIQGKSGFGIKIVGTFNDAIINYFGGTIRGAGPGATIQMGDGADLLVNRGAIVSDMGNAIDMEAGNDALWIENHGASIVGDVSGGAGTDSMNILIGAAENFSYAGVLSNVETLNLRGGTLTLDGVNRVTSTTALVSSGGSLALTNTSGANAQTFASLTLNGNATLDLGLSSITFDALGNIGAGNLLTVIDWSSNTSPDYAFRFLGDTASSTAFLALISGATINGLAAMYSFDGLYTNVNAVPVPAALALFASGLGLLAAGRRRRKSASRD